MMRKRPQSASRKWHARLSTAEASRKLSFGLPVPQQNDSVQADPRSSGDGKLWFKPRICSLMIGKSAPGQTGKTREDNTR